MVNNAGITRDKTTGRLPNPRAERSSTRESRWSFCYSNYEIEIMKEDSHRRMIAISSVIA